MKVAIISSGQDTGGQGYRIVEGFRRHAPEWTVENVNTMRSALGYPEHFEVPMGRRVVIARDMYRAADVVHLRNSLNPYLRWDNGNRKPVILHHHGTMFREAHAKLAGKARQAGAVQLASTMDLVALEPGVAWLPSPYNLDELAALRSEVYQPSEQIRVSHFPTSAKVKSSALFMDAANLPGVELITNVHANRAHFQRWPDVLRQKAASDIHLDQLILGYGNNAVEAWAMGIPVVAGVQDKAVRKRMVETWGRLPFVEATEATIAKVVKKLVESAAMRNEYAEIGLAHVRRWHADAVVVGMLQDIYGAAASDRQVAA